jgi:hypothetical protein
MSFVQLEPTLLGRPSTSGSALDRSLFYNLYHESLSRSSVSTSFTFDKARVNFCRRPRLARSSKYSLVVMNLCRQACNFKVKFIRLDPIERRKTGNREDY